MNMYDIIYKKREGGKISAEEIRYFVEGYTAGEIPDYQAAALLMAVFFSKMDAEETYELTIAMRDSGERADLSAIDGIKVDKHSTGGVGDKTSLAVAPLAAACGVKIAKMSGRGLGFTGGTIDKLESIPGFRTALEPEEFFAAVNKTGLSIIGQSAHIAAADKKLYALRDVTATVDNLSLIMSSIMSKKLASGSDALVLDVKCGNGAFMESSESAEELARGMVEIGKREGKRTLAVISDMSRPLGKAVGNAIEVEEAIDTLKGSGPADITELSLSIAGLMIFLGGKAESAEEGRGLAEEAMKSGAGLRKFADFVENQGGDKRVVEDYSLFPRAKYRKDVLYHGESAYVSAIETKSIGMASQHSGAGRRTKEDEIDPAAGISVEKTVGDRVEDGCVLASIFSNDEGKLAEAAREAERSFAFSAEKPERPALIKKIIGL